MKVYVSDILVCDKEDQHRLSACPIYWQSFINGRFDNDFYKSIESLSREDKIKIICDRNNKDLERFNAVLENDSYGTLIVRFETEEDFLAFRLAWI